MMLLERVAGSYMKAVGRVMFLLLVVAGTVLLMTALFVIVTGAITG